MHPTIEEKTITYNDPIVPTTYVEKPPFPVRIKDHAKASTVQVKVEPNIATRRTPMRCNGATLTLRVQY